MIPKSPALKNRPGTIATDFAYFTPEGDHRTLHTTPSAHCLLLMFYNPDCTHCRQTIALLHDDRLFKQMLHDGLLTVLAINTENTPETAPRPEAAPRAGNRLPTDWMAGTASHTLTDNELYILPLRKKAEISPYTENDFKPSQPSPYHTFALSIGFSGETSFLL